MAHSSVWPYIRSQRAAPLKRAAGGTRREDFTAALEQAEQLFQAAAEVGVQTSPLLLFYGTSQLGRALCAALASGEDYGKLNSHGLKPLDPHLGVLDSKVVVCDRGLFPAAAKVLGCPAIARPVRLAELIATIPEVRDFSKDILPDLPGPLDLFADRISVYAPNPFAHQYDVATGVVTHGIPDGVAAADDPRTALLKFLQAYPAFSDAIIPDNPVFADDNSTAVAWPWASTKGGDDFEERVRSVEAKEAAYGFMGSSFVFPALSGIGVVPPLLAWWLILFGLSTHARYHPGVWGREIDVDRTESATLIEMVLAAAIQRVPDLMLKAYADLT